MSESIVKQSLLTRLPGGLFYLAAFTITLYGWLQQTEWVHIPEEGVGYALGIIGGLMLLFQALYPLRKRINRLKQFGHTRFWFSSHIASGVVAPIVLLFHCNFQLGSLNSQVALFSMLAVALSGLLGKYLYTRIHYGLHGRTKEFSGLREHWQKHRDRISKTAHYDVRLEERLNRFEQPILDSIYHPILAVLRLSLLSLRGHLLYLKTRGLVSEPAEAHPSEQARKKSLKAQRRLIRTRINAACELARFSAYERLFALWHVVHLPFFFIMLLAGIAHITAVHLY
ncbi:MAG: hypothetical protein L3J28_10945 [Candidatus Polarisedimenticolaceae bacterium]|nr:hypothetical protein [Candidatus Polarisedimenticolaceae bacterium]